LTALRVGVGMSGHLGESHGNATEGFNPQAEFQ
jgi:hypothetical protein